MKYTYQDMLAFYGVGGAHPGGLELTKRILKNENINKDSVILDAGCGTGQTAAYISDKYHCSIYALDSHPLMIKKAKQRFKDGHQNVHILEGDVEKLPFPDAQFDFVLAESVTFFTNVSKSISEYYRVLKFNGVLITLDMIADFPLSGEEWKELQGVYGNINLYSQDEWLLLIEDAGFTSNVPLLTTSIMESFQTFSFVEDSMPEFNLSSSIDPEVDNILSNHQLVTSKYADILGFHVIRSQK
jgi:ubiquinone/menaquinone biosynthesis C-methylase UbiE